MYWFIVAALVILNIIAALWAVTGIRRELGRYRKEAGARRGLPLGRHKATDKRGGRKDVPAAKKKARRPAERAAKEEHRDVKAGAENRRWQVVLENIPAKEISDYIFCRSIGIGRTGKDTDFEDFLSIPYDQRISKTHCSIYVGKDGLYLKDEGSTNHTYLNGNKIQKPEMIKKGDVISIGETQICVVKILREAI